KRCFAMLLAAQLRLGTRCEVVEETCARAKCAGSTAAPAARRKKLRRESLMMSSQHSGHFRVAVIHVTHVGCTAPFRARLADFSLLDLHPVFPGNFVQLVASELLWRRSRSARYFTKKLLKSRRCHNPKQQ